MRTHWKYIVVSLCIGWLIGIATGLCGMHGYRHNKFFDKSYGQMREKLYQELSLSPEQRAHVESVMEETRKKMKDLRDAARKEIRLKLTPDQQLKYDAAYAKHEARRERRMNKHKIKND